MNIIEAIKSGKPYRRKNSLETFNPGDEYTFTSSEVLADDWEIVGENLNNEDQIIPLLKEIKDLLSKTPKTQEEYSANWACNHVYPTPWNSTLPPTCIKCGK